MFTNFKHKPLKVSAIEVTAEYVRSLDPEVGPLYPHFDSRTGDPIGVDWDNQMQVAGIGDFVIERKSGVYQSIGGDEFKAKYDPAW